MHMHMELRTKVSDEDESLERLVEPVTRYRMTVPMKSWTVISTEHGNKMGMRTLIDSATMILSLKSIVSLVIWAVLIFPSHVCLGIFASPCLIFRDTYSKIPIPVGECNVLGEPVCGLLPDRLLREASSSSWM